MKRMSSTEPAPPSSRKKSIAAGLAILISVATFAGVWALTDPIAFWPRVPDGRERRAAIAIRDRVPPFQQWGSRVFSLPQLERFYGETAYFTQGRDDQKTEFLDRLRSLLDCHEVVDVFLLAHSNAFFFWFQQIDSVRRQKLRLVYNTGCLNASQGQEWIELGARTYIGHAGSSESPIFYFFFLRRWLRSMTADEALKQSNAGMMRVLEGIGSCEGDAAWAEEAFSNSEALLTGDRTIRLEDTQP